MHDMLDTHMHLMHIDGMTLIEYLDESKESDTAFAGRVGLSQSQISRLKRGVSKPSWEAIGRISLATDGKVTANDWASQERAA